ncbi:MAG TPA: class I SAM-dependent methyltransferase [Longimicrobium sp.]|nr:class I SAM-dependent methyltransferase [Longimicrobium sp.]
MPLPPCPLCHSGRVQPFAELRTGRYGRCPVCRLVVLAPEHHPSPEAERAHYGTHENDPADPGYRAFLARVADPLAERLAPGAEGLDYGSGPGPALAGMMAERGFRMRIYDPFFAPDGDALRRAYDFVTCTETAEHFHHPAEEFARLDGLLRPGGWLGVMTELLDDARDFATWRYARDPTHVCFYHADTMRWIADAHGWRMEAPGRNVVLFHKPAEGGRGG